METQSSILKREFGYTVYSTPTGNRIVFDDADRQNLEASRQRERTPGVTASQLKAKAIDEFWQVSAAQWWRSKAPGYRAAQFLGLHGLVGTETDRKACNVALSRLDTTEIEALSRRVAATDFRELRQMIAAGTRLELPKGEPMNHTLPSAPTPAATTSEARSTLNQRLLKLQRETRKLTTENLDRVYEALADAGILLGKTMKRCEVQSYRTAKGVERERIMVTMGFTFESTEGHEASEFQWVGVANGVSQRAIEKAATGAERSFLTQQFGLKPVPAERKPRTSKPLNPEPTPVLKAVPTEHEPPADEETGLSYTQQVDAELLQISREIESVRGGEVLKGDAVTRWSLSTKRQVLQNLHTERARMLEEFRRNYAHASQELSKLQGDEPLSTKEIITQVEHLSLKEIYNHFRKIKARLDQQKTKAS